VVMVCPELLTALAERPRALDNVVGADRALAMLLGVGEDALTERDKAGTCSYRLNGVVPNLPGNRISPINQHQKQMFAFLSFHTLRVGGEIV
jgi:hypothetical protein